MDNNLHSYEIDAPEFFNKDADGSSNNFGFGVWDHFLPTRDSGHLPGRTWDYTANNSTIGNMANFVVIGLEWRTDNSQVVFINGVKKYTSPSSGMNDVESILPSAMILSTKVVDWLTKNVELDASEATWDYARYYQKPGWHGAVDGDWSKAANWGAEGVPSGGMAAVFNMPSTSTSVSLSSDQSLQTLSFDGATTPAHTFSGAGALRLGEPKAGDTTVTHGGILLNTEVQTNQTFNVPIVALQMLQLANLSRKAGGVLTLNGAITGSGSQDVEFITAMPAVGATTLGQIVLGQAIGAGIRHVMKAGDATLALPANSLHSGKTAISRGGVSITAFSALGTSPTEPLVFRPNTRHNETYRPRLIYTGPAASISKPVAFTGYTADGVIEASGTGAVNWTGNVVITPKTSDPARAPSANAFFTLGGTNTSDNTFAGNISDAGVSVTYDSVTMPVTLTVNKANGGTWVLTGTNSTKAALLVQGGRLFIGSGTSGSFDTPGITVSTGAEIGFGRDDAVSFSAPISGGGGLRKRGAGMLTLSGTHSFTGNATVEAGSKPSVSFGGIAFVGARGAWLANSQWNLGVCSHEVGHNFGMLHSGFWDTDDGTVIGSGSAVEYGNPFDHMGGASSSMDAHFGARQKNFLDWIVDADVVKITADGTTTTRIRAFDRSVAVGDKAIAVDRPGTTDDYWIEYRQDYADTNQWMRDGVILNWGDLTINNDKPVLLDNTPGGSKDDCPVLIGRTFSDATAGIHITPVLRGSDPDGTTWIDVTVNRGAFPGNLKPTVTMSATNLNPAVSASVTFTATATDPNGDTLGYHWDWGDGTFTANNSSTASKSWSTSGVRTVRCYITDMKGLTTTGQAT